MNNEGVSRITEVQKHLLVKSRESVEPVTTISHTLPAEAQRLDPSSSLHCSRYPVPASLSYRLKSYNDAS